MSRPRQSGKKPDEDQATMTPEASAFAGEDRTSGIVQRPPFWLPEGLRFERLLGYGSIGVVLAATTRTGELVAVKTLGAEHAASPEQRQRLLREAAAARRLSSAHVVRIIDVGERPEDGAPYIVMEYLHGNAVDEVLRLRGPFAPELALECVQQVLDALAEAHSAGLIHRDVKPSNLFLHVGADGRPFVKVLDFGLVKDLGTKHAGRITGSGCVMGTPAYMAPEQLRAEKNLDARVDVWAVGVTLHELLTGEIPFRGRSIPGILTAILDEPPASVRATRPELDERLDVVIRRCLAKSPGERYASASELASALRWAARASA